MNEMDRTEYGWHEEMGIPLFEKIRADLKRAMLERNTPVRDAIKIIMGEFPKLIVPITLESGKKSSRLKKPAEITDDDLCGIIRGLVKSERTVLEYKNEASSVYLQILEAYLPVMADSETISAWIDKNVDFTRFKSPMQAMGLIMKHFGKRADGNVVKMILQKMAGS